MASLCPQLPILQTHNIERPPNFDIALSGDDLDPRVGRDSRIELVEEIVSLKLSNGCTLKLGTGLQQEQRDILAPTLIANADLFAWWAAYLPGVDPQVAVHKLSIYKEARYILQKKMKVRGRTTTGSKSRSQEITWHRVHRWSPLHYLAL